MGEGLLTREEAAVGGEGASTGAGLACEGVPLEAIAETAGTPVYVYGAAAIREAYHRLDAALAPTPHRIHYSVKANSSQAVLRLLRGLGSGVDVVSGGELHRARRAGFDGPAIVFGGVGKTPVELREALTARVLLVNVESEAELHLLDEVAASLGAVAQLALRINPEVTVDTPHPYTRTGERGVKFGIAPEDALGVARTASRLAHVRLAGLDMHIGSQVSRLEPFITGLERVLELQRALHDEGIGDALRYIDMGGGLAVTYDREHPTDVDALARALHPMLRGTDVVLIVEPGRYLVANAGTLLTRVLYRKRSGGREYVITDAGMTDLVRPSHYNAYHVVEPVRVRAGRERIIADVVGPVCESGDFFALGRELDAVAAGDVLAIRSAGAYGFVMASTYNSRPRPAEVLVDGNRFAVVTERERYEDLVRHEPAHPRWRSA